MMDRFLRLASIVFVAAGLAACDDDDTGAPAGEASTVNVSVYIEADGESGLTGGDTPIPGATVTLTDNDGGETLTATTAASGIATFSDVPAGIYTLTHAPASPITNATLTGNTTRTLVAQFEGGTSSDAFVYSFNPGSIAGTIFRDENENDTYEEADDTTLAGFQVVLFAGADTTSAALETQTVDSTGTFLFDGLAPGDYTLLLRPIIGAEVSDSTIAVTVAAGETSTVMIEFTGGEAVTDIADARALEDSTVVTIEGVITAGTNVFSGTTAYVQDATGAILIDQFEADTVAGGSVTPLSIGDSVLVTGQILHFSGEQRIGGKLLTVEVVGTADVPDPIVVTASDINAGDDQAELVQVVAVTLDSIASGSGAFSFNESVWAHDATGDFIIFIDGTTGIDSTFISYGSTYNVTGIVSIFGSTEQLKPRSSEDLDLTSTPTGTQSIAIARLLEDEALVTVEGVVIAGTGTYNTSTIYVQDNTAGILVFHGTGGSPSYAVGDSIRIAGELDTFSGERELANVTITPLGTGTLPTPTNVTGGELNAGQNQGELVIADSVEVLSVSESSSGNVTVVVRDETDTFTIFGDVDTGLDQTNFTVGSSYSITGVAASFNDLRQIKPRSLADVVAL